MSDETTHTPAPAPASPAPDTSDLRAQLRAVSAERSRLAGELKAAQEQAAKFQADLKSSTTRHSQDMHLVSAGITSKRGRRAIRREYADALSEVSEGGEAPAFGAFVDDLKDDPLYGRWFSTAADKPADKPAEAAPVKAKRKPASNPNAGTVTPKPPDTEIDAKGYRAQRQKLGRKGVLAANLELLKKQGLVS